MIGFLSRITRLHYSKYLERSGRISGTILIVLGAVLLFNGLKNIITHLHMRKTKYTIVPGKVVSWEKKETHVKLSRKTDYFPTLEFTYEGKVIKARSKRSFGEETMTAFDKASKEGRFEVRVPVGDPYEAVPNYELERNEKLYSGLIVSLCGAFLVALGVFFILNRPAVQQ